MTKAKTKAATPAAAGPLSAEDLQLTHAFWRACNYLGLGMIYLQENPLLRKPLEPAHIKSRLLGHWGASPGLSFVYTHLNRLIRKHDLDVVYMAGPGHGAPGMLAPVWLEGSYGEVYPENGWDEEGLRLFFKEFSFSGGIGSHCTPETPGSIHEGGELGYVLSHACGAVLPVLNLNGYKINNPTLLTRISYEELDALFRGYGWTPHFVEGSDPMAMHQRMAAVLEECVASLRPLRGASARIRTPTAACSSARCACPTSAPTPSRSRSRGPSTSRSPARSGRCCATSRA